MASLVHLWVAIIPFLSCQPPRGRAGDERRTSVEVLDGNLEVARDRASVMCLGGSRAAEPVRTRADSPLVVAGAVLAAMNLGPGAVLRMHASGVPVLPGAPKPAVSESDECPSCQV